MKANTVEVIDFNKWVENYIPLTTDGKPAKQDGEFNLDECILDLGDVIAEDVAKNLERIWSYVSEDGKDYLEAGVRYVNVVGFVITEKPHNNIEAIVPLD